jgi:hypothetical protein
VFTEPKTARSRGSVGGGLAAQVFEALLADLVNAALPRFPSLESDLLSESAAGGGLIPRPIFVAPLVVAVLVLLLVLLCLCVCLLLPLLLHSRPSHCADSRVCVCVRVCVCACMRACVWWSVWDLQERELE